MSRPSLDTPSLNRCGYCMKLMVMPFATETRPSGPHGDLQEWGICQDCAPNQTKNLGYFMGIDPGASGGIAIVSHSDGAWCWKMPPTEKDVVELVKSHAHTVGHCLIEIANAFPKQGLSSTFKFGTNYGFLRAVLHCTKVRFEQISAPKWQRYLSIPPRAGKTQTQHKNVLKARAQQLFPGVKRITLATADALLLAETCRRMYQPKPRKEKQANVHRL